MVSCLEEEALGSVDAALASPFPDHYEQVDPATWRTVRLRFDDHAEVPTIVELLRPAAWLTYSGVAVGALVPLHIEEFQISGLARVEAIRPCPEIADPQGPGRRVVTATSRRLTPETLTLSLQEVAPGDATCPKWSTGISACISTTTGTSATTGTTGTTTAGWVSTLGTTANHPIWSLDRATWIAAGELQPGEFVRSGTGATVVLSSCASGPAEVLNLEAHRSHTFEVGESRVVVRNSHRASGGQGGAAPPNLTPSGAGRRGALREALRRNGVPTSQQPFDVKPNFDLRGKRQPGRVYVYLVPSPY